MKYDQPAKCDNGTPFCIGSCEKCKSKSMRDRFDERFILTQDYEPGVLAKYHVIKDFIEQELKKEREEIVEMIEKKKWRGIACRGNEFEADLQNEAYDNIINTISKTYRL